MKLLIKKTVKIGAYDYGAGSFLFSSDEELIKQLLESGEAESADDASKPLVIAEHPVQDEKPKKGAK